MNLFERWIEKKYLGIKNNLALYDQLSGTYNYNWLNLIAREKYRNRKVYITVIDLNNFKEINDSIGHIAANGVLLMIGEKLLGLTGVDKSVEVARFGGDEFTIFSETDISNYIKDDTLISYGSHCKKADESLDSAINIADKKMYKYKAKAKKEGLSPKLVVKNTKKELKKNK